MNIVFCADKGVLPGLHVAAYSLLDRISPDVAITRFYIFSDALNNEDIALLNQTLQPLKKPYSLELRRIDPFQFAGYPSLNGSWATYYRLAVPKEMDDDRFLYVDADTLCDIDVSPLDTMTMGDSPAALVPEAPLSGAADRYVAEQLGNSSEEPYYNAGVCLVNRVEWVKQGVTQLALEYLKNNPAHYWDQSALNIVLHGKALSLDQKYNTISNMRKNWIWLKQPYGQVNRLIHFLDYPKPWDLGAEMIHPHYSLWGSVLEETAVRDFRSWQKTPARKFPSTAKAKQGYKKALKDQFLFQLYKKNIFTSIKGVNKNEK